MIYRFDTIEVDDRAFRLSDGGTPVQLEPKALRLLIYLIENRNRLVRKQELLDGVWPEAMVTENALTRVIGLLRKALNEDSRVPRFIETVPTAGYRFIAQVTVVDGSVTKAEIVADEALPVEQVSDTGPEKAKTFPATMSRRAMLWTAGAAAVSGAGLWVGRRWLRKDWPPAVTVAIQLLEQKQTDDAGMQPGTPVVAPDGSAIVFAMNSPDGRFLFMRRLEAAQATRMEGTEGGTYPFWSPDSQHIGFFAGVKLKRVPAAGGSPVVLCDSGDPRGATWNRRGTILFAPNLHGLSRVSESGGDPTAVTQLDKSAGENSHRFPVFMPDGNQFLYFSRSDDGEKRGIYLESLDRKTPRRRILLAGSQFALGIEEHSGDYYLITFQGGKTVAQQYDVDRGELKGVSHVLLDRGGWSSISDTGVLVIQSGSGSRQALTWRDREGRKTGEIAETGEYWQVSLSPDGRFVAALKHHPISGAFSVWTASLPEALLEPFSDADHVQSFVWSHDSSTLMYDDHRQGKLFHRTVSPKGLEITDGQGWTRDSLQDTSPDGKYLVGEVDFNSAQAKTAWTAADHQQWQELGHAPPEGLASSFSPDGKWLAYGSDKTGAPEIYVMDFPQGEQNRRISVSGGTLPRWRRDGKELFFVAPDGNLMSVAMSGGGLSKAGAPTPLFKTNLSHTGGNHLYDVTADGQRFLLIERPSEITSSIEMILNWPSLLPR